MARTMEPYCEKTGVSARSPARLAIVGTGALGSEVCRLLLEAGTKDLLLIDPDVLSPHNLALSSLFQRAESAFGQTNIGQPKAELLVRLSQLQHSHLCWRALVSEVADVGLGLLKDCHAFLSCPDNALARIETAYSARRLQIPMIDGGVRPEHPPEGRISFFPPNLAAACYLCGIRPGRRADLLTFATASSLSCKPIEDPSPMSDGLLTPAAIAVVARAMIAEWDAIKPGGSSSRPPSHAFAVKLKAVGDRRTSSPCASEDERVALQRSTSCPWHTFPPPNTLVTLPHGLPIRDFLLAQPVEDLQVDLSWPVCLEARCMACRFVSQPRQRVGRVRRAACAVCGSAGRLDPLKTLSSLHAPHPLAGLTPEQLGLPREELYALRPSVVWSGRGGKHPIAEPA